MDDLNEKKNSNIRDMAKEQTILAIKNSFKDVIEVKAEKIMIQNKYRYDYNYDWIKGKELLDIIESLEKKIATPNQTNFNVIDLFEKYILYGFTPLYTSCMKAFELFGKKEDSKNNNVLIIISDDY